jgi:hypothetical protein
MRHPRLRRAIVLEPGGRSTTEDDGDPLLGVYNAGIATGPPQA